MRACDVRVRIAEPRKNYFIFMLLISALSTSNMEKKHTHKEQAKKKCSYVMDKNALLRFLIGFSLSRAVDRNTIK